MKRSFMMVLLTAATLTGQEPEIRRALPVEPSDRPVPTPRTAAPAVNDYDNPGWMDRVPRAIPVATPAPTPVAAPEPDATPEPAFRPESYPTPQGRIEVAPTPAPTSGTLVPGTVSESNRAQADLDVANSLYARKMYDYAIPEYEKFLIAHPSAEGGDMALFRLGECHRMQGNTDPARASYEKLVQKYRTGEFAGSGAYRLGEFLYAEGKFEPALRQFQTAASEVKGDEIRLSARYNMARCLDRLKRTDEALKAYSSVASVKKNNPYRDYALLSLANLEAANGRKEAALASFESIVTGKGASVVRAEAAVKGAALAAELGDKKKAVRMFELANQLPDAGEWKTVAFLGSLRMNYDQGDYKKVAALADSPMDGLPADAQAEVLLLAGNSYRQLGNTRAARAVYDRLLIQFPDATPSQDARFHRLIGMYQAGDPNLLTEVDEFLAKTTNPKEKAQAGLIKAETLFKTQKYADALPLYAQVLQSELPDELKNKSLYKLGWCQAQTGKTDDAIAAYTLFIEKNPDNSASALLQRGLALQQKKDYDAAMRDFDQLIEKNKGTEREVALQQKALILGQKKDYDGMADAFRQLLKEYPETAGAAQANFWIGWARFENKDYSGAIENLTLAKKLDPDQYGERSVLRIILCYYYLEDLSALQKVLAENQGINVPVEITRWLGRKSFEQGNYEAAELGLLPVVQSGQVTEPEVYIELAEAQIRLGKTREAGAQVEQFMKSARDPRSRARGLLAQAAIAVAARDYAGANKLAEEAILLQPEGRLNADGRMMTGEISYASGDYPGAARAFKSVALLYDDPVITPRALRRASDAYRKAGDLMESENALQELEKRFPESQKSAKKES